MMGGATRLEPATSGVAVRRSRWSGELRLAYVSTTAVRCCLRSPRCNRKFASAPQASAFRSDATVFRLNARPGQKTGSLSAFGRNTAERVYLFEAAHNPEVAGSNPAPLLRKALETGPFRWEGNASVPSRPAGRRGSSSVRENAPLDVGPQPTFIGEGPGRGCRLADRTLSRRPGDGGPDVNTQSIAADRTPVRRALQFGYRSVGWPSWTSRQEHALRAVPSARPSRA